MRASRVSICQDFSGILNESKSSHYSFFSPELINIIYDYTLIDSSVTKLKTLDVNEELIDKRYILLNFVDNENLSKFFSNEQIEVLTLLNHVVRGEKDEAEKLIKQKPELLLFEGIVTDYSGRDIRGTALKIALGAEDVNIQQQGAGEQKTENIEGMAEMIIHYFKKLNNGEEELKKQIDEQFPKGWKENEKEREKEDLKALTTVINVIEKAAMTAYKKTESIREVTTECKDAVVAFKAECKDAVEAFRFHLMPNIKVIDSGKHFNAKLLTEAVKLYAQIWNKILYSSYFGYSSAQQLINDTIREMFEGVIGFIQRYLPACYAQAFAQSIYMIIDSQERLRRRKSFGLRENNTPYMIGVVYIFPLDNNPRRRLGFDCVVNAFGTPNRADATFGSRHREGVSWPAHKLLEAFCDKKTKSMQSIMQQYSSNNSSFLSCAIM